TFAIFLHEIPQEIGDFGVLIHGGFSVRHALAMNLLTATTAIAGALLVFVIGSHVESFSLWLLPFAAGSFLYIAGSDLIPELHREVDWRKSVGQLVFFLLGIYAMILLLGLE
ncbi:MAG: ZIP family metal transporter, partial [archaeon]